MAFDIAALNSRSLKVTTTRPDLLPFLTVDLYGPGKAGKSHFGLTAPGPLLHMNLGLPSELDGVIQHFEGKQIVEAQYRSNVAAEAKQAEIKDLFRREQTRLVGDLQTALKAGVRSVTVDKATELWEVVRLGLFGRLDKVPAHLYGEANSTFADLLGLVPAAGANLVLIHEERDEWEDYLDDKGAERRRPSGRKLRKGNEKVEYLVDVALRSYRTPPVKDAAGTVISPVRFMNEVLDCRQNPSLIGQAFENLDFPTLAMMVKPQVPAEVWL